MALNGLSSVQTEIEGQDEVNDIFSLNLNAA